MAQQYYEYVNYREEHVQEQKKLPKGVCHSYIIIFQSVFNIIFHVSLRPSFVHSCFMLFHAMCTVYKFVQVQKQISVPAFSLFLTSWVLSLRSSPWFLSSTTTCTRTNTFSAMSKPAVKTRHFTFKDEWLQTNKGRTAIYKDWVLSIQCSSVFCFFFSKRCSNRHITSPTAKQQTETSWWTCSS